jgi:hypothetical protein
MVLSKQYDRNRVNRLGEFFAHRKKAIFAAQQQKSDKICDLSQSL